MSQSVDPIKAAKMFEFYVRKIWPTHRHWAKEGYAPRCQRCAASVKMVPLNSKGICQLCEKANDQPSTSNLRLKNSEAILAMETLLHEHQGAGKGHYDALIMFSGGKDSAFLTQKIKSEYPKLRLLCCTIDNSYMSPIAKQNIEHLLSLLDVDHVFIRPHKQFYKTLFRYTITHLNAEGSYGTVDFSDGEFMLDSARRLAAEKRIPLILCGYSRYQVQNGLKLDAWESPRERERKPRSHVAGLPLDDIFDPADQVLWWQGSKDFDDSEIARLLFPLYAWDLEEDEIKNAVVQWGLIPAKDQSPIVTNHQLIPLLGVVDVHRFGYSSFEYEFCRMIREGRADRHQWQMTFEFLEYCSRTGLFLKDSVHYLLKELDLTLEDVGIQFVSKGKMPF